METPKDEQTPAQPKPLSQRQIDKFLISTGDGDYKSIGQLRRQRQAHTQPATPQPTTDEGTTEEDTSEQSS